MAGSVDRILTLKLLGDVGNINKDLNKTQGKLGKLGGAAKSWGKAFAFTAIIAGIGLVTGKIKDAWEEFRLTQAASAALKTTWENLGKKAGKLEGILGTLSDRAYSLGEKDSALIDAFNQSLLRTGDGAESMREVNIALDLVASGGASSLGEAIDIIDKVGRNGVRTISRFGLTGKNAAENLDQLEASVQGAADSQSALDPLGTMFGQMNSDLGDIVGHLSKGNISGALESLARAGGTLGTAFNDIAPKVMEAIEKVDWDGIFDGIVEALKNIIPTLLRASITMTGKILEGIAAKLRSVDWPQLLTDIVNMLKDVIPKVITSAKELAGKMVDGIVNFVKDADWGVIWTSISSMLKDVAKDAGTLAINIGKDIAKAVINTIKTTDWGAVFTTVINVLRSLAIRAFDKAKVVGTNIFKGIIKMFTGADWGAILRKLASTLLTVGRKIWPIAVSIGRKIVQGVMDWVANLPTKLVGLFKRAINSIIRLWNNFNFAWADIKVGPVVVLPKGRVDFPDIPFLAKGGIVTKPTLAMLGEGGHDEAIIPLDGRHGLGGGITVNVNALLSDPAEVGRAVVDAIQQYESRAGSSWRFGNV